MGKEKSTEISPEFRVSYPHVFEPQENELSGKMEYTVTALFTKKTDLAKLEALVRRAKIAKWGENPKKWPKMKNETFRDQAELGKEDDDGEIVLPEYAVEGALWCRLKSREAPGVIGPSKKPILDASDFYAGCWARAEVAASAYDRKGNRGVSLWMNNLQKLRDDDPISGRRKAEDVFESVEEDDDGEGSGKGVEDLF